MAITSILWRFGSVMSALPTPFLALAGIKQARTALESGSPARAAEIAQKGIGDLTKKQSDPALGPVTTQLKASLLALFATSQRRVVGTARADVHAAFREADQCFTEALKSDSSAFTNLALRPYYLIIDYLVMLVDF